MIKVDLDQLWSESNDQIRCIKQQEHEFSKDTQLLNTYMEFGLVKFNQWSPKDQGCWFLTFTWMNNRLMSLSDHKELHSSYNNHN